MITSPLCHHGHPLWSPEPCAKCIEALSRPITAPVTDEDDPFHIPAFLTRDENNQLNILAGVPAISRISVSARIEPVAEEPPPAPLAYTQADFIRAELEEKKKARAKYLQEKRDAIKREKEQYDSLPKSKRRWDTRRSKWVAEE